MSVTILLIIALSGQVDAQPSDSGAKPADVAKPTSDAAAQPASPSSQADDKASIVSLSGVMTLEELLASLEKQTGNKITDYRSRFNQPASNPQLKLTVKNAPFWKVFDTILDSAQLNVYQYSGKDGLALVSRPGDQSPRTSRAAYAGPLRIEAIRVVGERRYSEKSSGSMKLDLEISWEPRLTPIAIVQPLAQFQAVDDQGQAMKVDYDGKTIDAAAKGGTSVEMFIPFTAPPRTAASIASIKGTLNVLLSGDVEQFEFDKIADATKPQFKGVEKRKGSATVVFERVRKNNEVWEVLLRVRFADGSGTEAHLDQIAQNEAYFLGPNQSKIDNAGFQTMTENKNELGMAYQFELPDGPDGCTFVYKTPSSFRLVQIPYELKDLALP